MIQEIVNELNNKKINILGFGAEGRSTYRFIRKYLPKDFNVTISDKNLKLEGMNEYKEDKNLCFILGDNYLDNINDYDLIIKTPGISLKDIDIYQIKDKITSQLNLFLKYTENIVVGVTGTKGKSTTSSLIYQTLKYNDKDSILMGNIGLPVFDVIEDINKDTICVYEMSSHQLEFVKYSPKIAIILNIYPEHLDFYKSYDSYIESKLNVFKYQKKR